MKSAQTNKQGRLLWPDVLRETALLGMAIFHALYCLVVLGLARLELWNGFWWWYARSVACVFVLLAGWSLAAKVSSATDVSAPTSRQLARRVVRLAVPAAGISLVTFIFLGRVTWVFFGVLHLLTLSTLVGWPLAKRPRVAALLAPVVLGLGLWLGRFRFDLPWLAWLGFRPRDLYPVDYLPLLPWFAWFLAGIVAFHGLKAFRPGVSSSVRPAKPAPPVALLAWLGRHSLAFYLAHIPVLYGLFWLYARFFD